jgi:hypothetical protein
MWNVDTAKRPMLLNRIAFIATVAVMTFVASAMAQQNTKKTIDEKAWPTDRICREIERVATIHNLPKSTFARLIWTESRFDILARSPVGAEGIAQFMPATAKAEGLLNSYNPALALPASAALLAKLRSEFGNFGLAAAAYNAGPGRVSRYLKGQSGLPFETLDYVAAITGQPAAYFKREDAKVNDFALRGGKNFQEGCKQLPILKTRFRGAVASRMPWGVQVAGNFSRSKAMRSWTRVRGKLGVSLGNAKPTLYRQKRLRGLKAKWAVRLGTKSRNSAIALCKKIRGAGGFCLVKKN